MCRYKPGVVYELASCRHYDLDERHKALFNLVREGLVFASWICTSVIRTMLISSWGMDAGQMSSGCTNSSDLGMFVAVFPCEATVPCKWTSSYTGLAFLYFLEKNYCVCVCVGTLIVVLGRGCRINSWTFFSSTLKWVSGVTPQCSVSLALRFLSTTVGIMNPELLADFGSLTLPLHTILLC